MSIIGYGRTGGHKNHGSSCRRLTVHATSIIFVSAYFAGILRGFCRGFAEGDGVSIIDVSNDRKVTYVLHRDKLLCLTPG
ncbi:hypothetical protein FBB67_24210 [Salmonella enterica]|nr:hypothetical protein [Salmonella enterica]EAO6112505.1 hypothetical protein [Salmonella enterica]EAQ4628360.1 hypothetical protein [Salmonella enterica]EAQ5598223.1 hypothetical protein [Salmonella enterica]EAS0766930.1 hypothetical protein [Salmonella enterica]